MSKKEIDIDNIEEVFSSDFRIALLLKNEIQKEDKNIIGYKFSYMEFEGDVAIIKRHVKPIYNVFG